MANTDILFFHSKSAVKPLPGKGSNEHVADPAAYEALMTKANWRQTLSNFWPAPFVAPDGHRYNSVEHYFQAKKLYIALGPERFFRQQPEQTFESSQLFRMFCLDAPDSAPSAAEDGSAAQKRRKHLYLAEAEIALWDQRKESVMYEGQLAKFSQNSELGEILLATGTAQLWHGAARQPRSRMVTLERVRDVLRSAQG
jgi:predicted NAD-dependent protein-ADP-ribosyltransferase YbiA (DUF1768 family)